MATAMLLCRHCGQTFSRPKPQPYCSMKCAQQHRDPDSRRGERLRLTCARCGKAFVRNASAATRYGATQYRVPATRTFCSPECRPEPTVINCAVCGQQRRLKPSQVGTGVKYCSMACMKLGRVTTMETRSCPTCEQSFTCPWWSKAVCCSAECGQQRTAQAHRGMKRRPETIAKLSRPMSPEHRAKVSAAKQGVPNPKKRKPSTPIMCRMCQQAFQLPGRHYRRAGTTRYCSRQCKLDYQRAHPEAHPGWKGGTEPYFGPNWREQARQARKRDSHTCLVCRKHQIRPALDVHHIRPRREFKGDYLVANALPNLATLCHSCHKRVESGSASIPMARR